MDEVENNSDLASYQQYALLYINDVLAISENVYNTIREVIGLYFELKDQSVGTPKVYLGGSVHKVDIIIGAIDCQFSSSQYAQAMVKNVDKYLEDICLKLPKIVGTHIRTAYRPDIDVTAELGTMDVEYYQ